MPGRFIIHIHIQCHSGGAVHFNGPGQKLSSPASAAAVLRYQNVKNIVFLLRPGHIQIACNLPVFNRDKYPEKIRIRGCFFSCPEHVFVMQCAVLLIISVGQQLNSFGIRRNSFSRQLHILLFRFKRCSFSGQHLLQRLIARIEHKVHLEAGVLSLQISRQRFACFRGSRQTDARFNIPVFFAHQQYKQPCRLIVSVYAEYLLILLLHGFPELIRHFFLPRMVWIGKCRITVHIRNQRRPGGQICNFFNTHGFFFPFVRSQTPGL